jgi:hypothetical protein
LFSQKFPTKAHPMSATIRSRFQSRTLAALTAIAGACSCAVVGTVYAAEPPASMIGERVNKTTGASKGLAMRALSYADGKLQGRADVWIDHPKAGTNCSRSDVAVSGQYSVTAEGRLQQMVVTYPSTRGAACDELTIKFVYDPASDSFVGEGSAFRWTLRAAKP